MIRKLCLLIIIAICFSPLLGSAQKIDSMMKVYALQFPAEKAYLQFDKQAYNPGERIWYKAYLFSGFDPSPYSKNFYTELYDASGTLILRNISPLSESVSSGSFDLPFNYEGTRIHVRAYTTWMMNFDTTFIYTKDIRIIGSSQDSITHDEPTPTVVNFFPEGGDMIAGIENTIAFKAEDGNGKPRKISGVLYEQTGKPLLDFKSTHNGMGKFLLIPDKQDVFYALWKDEKGLEHRSDLPAVKTSGVVLHVLNSPSKLVFSVTRAEESLANLQVTVIAHMNQQMIYRAVVNLKDVNMSGGSIPITDLPTGVLQITVFDMNQAPLAERICFINNNNYSFDGRITFSSKSLLKRGRNVVDLDLMDSLRSNLAIAITDAEVDGNRPYNDNIISALLITADIHGLVTDPYYYFKNNSDSLAAQLDLVMLTHGWRRFKWQDLAKGKVPVIKYPIDNYLSLNAEVLGISPSRIAKEETLNVMFSNKDSSTNMLTLPYIGNGKFTTTGLVFYDTAKAYYQFNTNRNLSNEAAVIFKNGLYGGIRKYKPFVMTIPVWSADDSSLVRKSRQVFVEIARLKGQDKKVQSLEVVTVRRRVKSNKEKLDETYSAGLFSGGSASIFDLINDPSASSMIDIFSYLQGRVAGLVINTFGPGGTPTLSWRGGSPVVYLNEMQADASTIKNIPVSDIAMVKVFSPGSGGAISGSGGGVISVYTKRGNDRPVDKSIKGLEMVRVSGYNVVREFYTPDYLINPEPETDDIRTTLYWNSALAGSRGKKRFSFTFYNSDITHRIRVTIEGIDEAGKMIHLEKILE